MRPSARSPAVDSSLEVCKAAAIHCERTLSRFAASAEASNASSTLSFLADGGWPPRLSMAGGPAADCAVGLHPREALAGANANVPPRTPVIANGRIGSVPIRPVMEDPETVTLVGVAGEAANGLPLASLPADPRLPNTGPCVEAASGLPFASLAAIVTVAGALDVPPITKALRRR